MECLELANTGGGEDSKYIPLEHPFFEEVQIKMYKIMNMGSPMNKTALNKYGKALCESKYNTRLGQNWFNEKKETNKDDKDKSSSEPRDKYQLFFIRAFSPCYQLEFRVTKDRV